MKNVIILIITLLAINYTQRDKCLAQSQWQLTIGGTNNDFAYSIIQTTDGGYAVAGYSWSFGADSADMYIVKLDANGTLEWTRTVGGGGVDAAFSIIQTTDGGFAVAGCTHSFGAVYYDMYIVKLNSSNTLEWSRTVGGTIDDFASPIIQTTDGGYVVAGCTDSFGAGEEDMYIVKLDGSGNTCGNFTSPSSISGSGGTLGTPASIVNSPTSTITTPSSTTSTGGTLTTICLVDIQPISKGIPDSYKLFQNYPNPFNPKTKIKFEIPQTPLS